MKKTPLYVREAWNESKELMSTNQGWIINTLLKIFTVGHCLVKVLLNIDVMYYLTYGSLAFIATMVHPFFFAFHLSEVVIRYPTLRNIIKSFWEPKVLNY
jgi:inositol 1,4,5-triphosphate receptor type 1/inositol 1,4,5-triphosphate receptor type 3